jgi:hypothetical protein
MYCRPGKKNVRTSKLERVNEGLSLCVFEVISGERAVKPSTEGPRRCVYLIDTAGPYTRNNLKCYKSLEAYNQYYSGWVQTCYFTKIHDCCIIKGRVIRSQATTETPHGAWVALDDKDATIVCAHCTCMAGYVVCQLIKT